MALKIQTFIRMLQAKKFIKKLINNKNRAIRKLKLTAL